MVTKGTLPKELKAEFEIDERKTKQDPDIKDREGTQPAKYYVTGAKGSEISPSTKKKKTILQRKKETLLQAMHLQKLNHQNILKSLNKCMVNKEQKKQLDGGKVQKLVTAHGLKFKGKVYKEIDMELVKINNNYSNGYI